jgi:ABC-type nickel/cobalt efflux system permease component RcnA
VDRSIQITIQPNRLQIDYEVSLAELTLTQDLRRLIGTLPGGDRNEWLKRYGEETGLLNARGVLVSVDGQAIDLVTNGFDLRVEEHPRYTFHFEAKIPDRGRLSVRDTNFSSSEGTSQLAIRGRDGVSVEGDDLPTSVADIPIRPVWELSDEEELRTKFVVVDYRPASALAGTTGEAEAGRPGPSAPNRGNGSGEKETDSATRQVIEQPGLGARDDSMGPSLGNGPLPRANRSESRMPWTGGLGRLLDRDPSASWLGLFGLAMFLGAAHSIQPGHGKSLISAVALGRTAKWYHPVLLGLVSSTVHTGSVLLLAAFLWWTGESRVASAHQVLIHLAGFGLAMGGFWRIGRFWGGQTAHDDLSSETNPKRSGTLEVLSLGLASGVVPCWDAVGLVVLAAAIGQPWLGVQAVFAFGLGMAVVLSAFGVLAYRLRTSFFGRSARRAGIESESSNDDNPPSGQTIWENRLSLASGLILASVGLLFFLS